MDFAPDYSSTIERLLYMWDITYLNGLHKGMLYYLYLFSDLYDRSIVGWEVYEEESAEHASELNPTDLPKAGTSYNAAASAKLRQWITDERRYYVSHFVSAWNYAIE